MHDAVKILLGLVVFVVIATIPFWLGGASDAASPNPKIECEDTLCVMDSAYMVAYHMDLLNQWRDEVVRHQDRIHVTPDGRRFVKSLSKTCMSCHANKETFCDECHNYASVTPYCWDCHVAPDLVTKIEPEPAHEEVQ